MQSSILTKVHIYEAVVCQFCDNARYIGQYSLCQDGGMALCPGREPTGSLARPCGHMDLEIPFGCLPYYYMHIADPRKILLRKEEGRTEAKSLIQHKIFGHFVYIFQKCLYQK